MADFQPTSRSKVQRTAKRGTYDRETIYAILDEGLVAHVGFHDGEQAYVIPMSYGRRGDEIIMHASPASRIVHAARAGQPLCITVTLLDGLVVARSVTNHSVNYRCVVAFGKASLISDENEKREALSAILEHFIPGREKEVRPATSKEIKATAVLVMRLEEASAKVRTGPPSENAADKALPHWAGEIPVSTTMSQVIPDKSVDAGTPVPPSVREYHRPGKLS